MTTFRKQYTDIKTRYTEIALEGSAIKAAEQLIILFQLGNQLEAFYEDAEKISHLCNKEMQYRLDTDGDHIPFVAIPFREEVTTAHRINEAGYKFTVKKDIRH